MPLSASVTRRRALVGVGAGLGAAACVGADRPVPPPPTGAFRHGVASGDPRATQVVIWTRVSDADAPVRLAWQVAHDPAFTRIAASGDVIAAPGADFTAKVDVRGLAPGTRYHYRFRVGDDGETSPVGRTATLPTTGGDGFALAAVSCSNHPAGWFNVYRDVADRAEAGEVDLVLHLGDYIYEYAPGGYATEWGAKNGRVPEPAGELLSLTDYRTRIAQYRSDPDLQAAHAAAPWVTVWDDHEVANNAHATGAQNHQPEDGDWTERRRAALRAYYEWMPVRDPAPGQPREALFRGFEIGDVASLIMLETRLLARGPEALWADCPVPPDAEVTPQSQAGIDAWLAATVGAPDRALLGDEQHAFVAERFAQSTAAGKPWQVLGNQVLLARMSAPNYHRDLPGWLKWVIRRQFPEAWDVILRTRFDIPLNLDQWDGFRAARARLYADARAAGARLVALTGDTHCFYTNALTDDDGAPMGWEFGTSSVTSPSEFNLVTAPGVDFGALTEARNPDILLHNAYRRGWTRLVLHADRAEAQHVRISTVTNRRYKAEVIHRYTLTPTAGGGSELTEISTA